MSFLVILRPAREEMPFEPNADESRIVHEHYANLVRLRDDVKAKEGANFSLQSFHDRFLGAEATRGGFLDKSDGTYQSAWILPTLLHEDTRYYAIGHGSKWKRLGYAMSIGVLSFLSLGIIAGAGLLLLRRREISFS